MKTVFEFAEACLYRKDIDEKLALTHLAKRFMEEGKLSFKSDTSVLPIRSVAFPEKPELLAPRNMPKRKLNSNEGLAAFFHAIAHIEFMAIYLAWDLLYRFRGLPEQFYRDWLTIADEEAQHFALIRIHLQKFNCDYGDFPAHSGLWDHATDTAEDLTARLALVPRCMEARGLDVTPAMVEKFKSLEDDASVSLLTRILTDEVGHVERGSYWFKFVCQQRGVAAETHYQQTLLDYYKGKKPKGPFNREMRIIAGFSHAELDWLEH
ncbi:MAG: ferritin-like domain-containing protein [Methylococcaceae bacterium]|nr:ferritin-like domain-containing protein [Methylococcaceae bacterium]